VDGYAFHLYHLILLFYSDCDGPVKDRNPSAQKVLRGGSISLASADQVLNFRSYIVIGFGFQWRTRCGCDHCWSAWLLAPSSRDFTLRGLVLRRPCRLASCASSSVGRALKSVHSLTSALERHCTISRRGVPERLVADFASQLQFFFALVYSCGSVQRNFAHSIPRLVAAAHRLLLLDTDSRNLTFD